MRPFLGGGDMIREVTRDAISYADPPMKFEAGTPGIVQTIGLGVALDYLTGAGDGRHRRARARLCATMPAHRLGGLNWLNVQGKAPDKGAIFSFTMAGAHAHDLSTILDQKGVAVRAGTHCAMPLLERLGVTATCRASFGLYNTSAEVDKLVEALETCHRLFG